MASLNKVQLIGNVGQDPDLRSTPSGAAVCNFSVATNKKGKDGQPDRTEWHRCVAWNKTAEAVHKYVRKGDPVYVEGELQTRKYEKDGQTHYSTEVIAWTVLFLKGKRDAEPDERPASEYRASEKAAAPMQDDDIPF